MKLLASSREDPTLLHANNTDADQSAHLHSPISAPVVHILENTWSSSNLGPYSGPPTKRDPNQSHQLLRPEYRNLARSKLRDHSYYKANKKGADQSARICAIGVRTPPPPPPPPPEERFSHTEAHFMPAG